METENNFSFLVLKWQRGLPGVGQAKSRDFSEREAGRFVTVKYTYKSKREESLARRSVSCENGQVLFCAS